MLNNKYLTTVEYRDRILGPEPYSCGVNLASIVSYREENSCNSELEAVICIPLVVRVIAKVSNGLVLIESSKSDR